MLARTCRKKNFAPTKSSSWRCRLMQVDLYNGRKTGCCCNRMSGNCTRCKSITPLVWLFRTNTAMWQACTRDSPMLQSNKHNINNLLYKVWNLWHYGSSNVSLFEVQTTATNNWNHQEISRYPCSGTHSVFARLRLSSTKFCLSRIEIQP